jgi:hypothetical protein
MRPVRQIWDKVTNNKTYHADLLHWQGFKLRSVAKLFAIERELALE